MNTENKASALPEPPSLLPPSPTGYEYCFVIQSIEEHAETVSFTVQTIPSHSQTAPLRAPDFSALTRSQRDVLHFVLEDRNRRTQEFGRWSVVELSLPRRDDSQDFEFSIKFCGYGNAVNGGLGQSYLSVTVADEMYFAFCRRQQEEEAARQLLGEQEMEDETEEEEEEEEEEERIERIEKGKQVVARENARSRERRSLTILKTEEDPSGMTDQLGNEFHASTLPGPRSRDGNIYATGEAATLSGPLADTKNTIRKEPLQPTLPTWSQLCHGGVQSKPGVRTPEAGTPWGAPEAIKSLTSKPENAFINWATSQLLSNSTQQPIPTPANIPEKESSSDSVTEKLPTQYAVIVSRPLESTRTNINPIQQPLSSPANTSTQISSTETNGNLPTLNVVELSAIDRYALAQMGSDMTGATWLFSLVWHCRDHMAPDSYLTLVTMGYLVTALEAVGQTDRAAIVRQELERRKIRELSPGIATGGLLEPAIEERHKITPTMLSKIHNYACVRIAGPGRWNLAVLLLTAVWFSREIVLGKNHTNTLASMRKLAEVNIEMGQGEKGAILLAEVDRRTLDIEL
ncbi:hypothetical protein RUND412_007399 [Rhizina undulata]